MAVIKANKVKFEVVKQNILGAASKYMIKLSYEPIHYESNELVSIILCNETPYITLSEEKRDSVTTLQETGPSLTPPPKVTTPEQLFGMEPTIEEVSEAAIADENMAIAGGRLTPEDAAWRSKK